MYIYTRGYLTSREGLEGGLSATLNSARTVRVYAIARRTPKRKPLHKILYHKRCVHLFKLYKFTRKYQKKYKIIFHVIFASLVGEKQ
jgi:hypothetical protein